jgi:hypothetical protein
MNPDKVSPQQYARTAGVLYLVIIVAAVFGEFMVRQSFIVSGDAAATAANIRDNPFLFRLGFASDLVAFLSDIGVSVIFYVLLRPVSQPLALLAAFFRLAQSTILGANLLNHLSASMLLGGASYLGVFSDAQLDALGLFFLERHAFGYDIALVFFAMHCVVVGYLIARSGFFPWVLGVLMVIAGVGYVADSYTSFLAPEINAAIVTVTLIPAVVAEFALTIWLLVRGVNAKAWFERAEAQAA